MLRPVFSRGPSTGPTSPATEPRASRLALLLGVALLGLGCTGTVGDGGKPSGNGNGNGSGNGSGSGSGGEVPPPPPNAVPSDKLPADDTSVPGVAPLRRLTRLEYQNTVRDLLGIAEVSAARLASFAADQDSEGTGFLRGGSVTAAPDARVLLLTAEELAAATVPRLPMLLPCSPLPAGTPEQDACADKFLPGFGKRAYRRPLTDAEVQDLKALYRAQRAADLGASFPQAISNVIAAVLQSPYFLYHWELGAAPQKDGNLVRYNQHEMASRLSYLLWASMPDDKLFEVADAGNLTTGDQVAVRPDGCWPIPGPRTPSPTSTCSG